MFRIAANALTFAFLYAFLAGAHAVPAPSFANPEAVTSIETGPYRFMQLDDWQISHALLRRDGDDAELRQMGEQQMMGTMRRHAIDLLIQRPEKAFVVVR